MELTGRVVAWKRKWQHRDSLQTLLKLATILTQRPSCSLLQIGVFDGRWVEFHHMFADATFVVYTKPLDPTLLPNATTEQQTAWERYQKFLEIKALLSWSTSPHALDFLQGDPFAPPRRDQPSVIDLTRGILVEVDGLHVVTYDKRFISTERSGYDVNFFTLVNKGGFLFYREAPNTRIQMIEKMTGIKTTEIEARGEKQFQIKAQLTRPGE